jgi:hypothetical protein
MAAPLNSKPNVQVTLEGLIATFVDPKNEKCLAGVLRNAPAGHDLKIIIKKADANGDFQPFMEINEKDVADELQIWVENVSEPGIRRRETPIDRLAGPTIENRDSFLWVVDFEKDLYPDKNIDTNKAGFRPMLTLNNGELVARALSPNELIIRRGAHGLEEVFGVVAVKTGIDIVLDQPNSKATFTNGEKLVFEADPNSFFKVVVSRVCFSVPGGSDADAYHSAIAQNVPVEERLFFSSTNPPQGSLSVPSNQDAACFVANGGSGGGTG